MKITVKLIFYEVIKTNQLSELGNVLNFMYFSVLFLLNRNTGEIAQKFLSCNLVRRDTQIEFHVGPDLSIPENEKRAANGESAIAMISKGNLLCPGMVLNNKDIKMVNFTFKAQ